MSEANGKVCCNCRHNIRFKDTVYKTTVYCICEVHNKYLPYAHVMCGWCRHWAKEKHKSESEVQE